MVYVPPPIALSDDQSAVQAQLTLAQFQDQILKQLIAGASPLQVAQAMSLTERQMTEALKEAFAIQTEFMKESAATYQQIIVSRHEYMYNFAIEQAMSSYEEETFGGSKKMVRGHLGWFDAAHKTLLALSNILKPHLTETVQPIGDIHITMIGGTVAFEKAKHLSALVGKELFDVIEGRLDDLDQL